MIMAEIAIQMMVRRVTVVRMRMKTTSQIQTSASTAKPIYLPLFTLKNLRIKRACRAIEKRCMPG